ncbi:PaaI family thioesterase [Bosea sp. (in: a-proteobacteria)]|uniref:PaaI family thioesterase n=1 Tax=Bosea sp. (in: a-proteobacteria) TaxID=1871050 RepID=UPI002B49DB57|nr:PaaI family thioesterase [Bosea sp. (in: a-proteobacteria)]WRH57923.1 MAG: PaaI family thioesterase [Bosea sp. (in: a-proteobacteria)]
MLDSPCGVAVHSELEPGQSYTTLELKIDYLRPLSERSGKVRAERRVVSFGRRVAFAAASLRDEQGRLCATASRPCF